MKHYYDLHMHSALSPCADDDMTINNIVNMACINGLNLISITDHNSIKNQKSAKIIADKMNIKYIFGVEVQSKEEVHILGYFKYQKDIIKFDEFLNKNTKYVENKPDYFGNQYVLNENDEVIEVVDNLLIVSIRKSVNEICDKIHECNGKVVLAHVIGKANGIIETLGFIPLDVKYDGIEIKKSEDKEKVLKIHKNINETLWFKNSDAHSLIDISEENHLDFDLIEFWWGNNNV